MSTNREPQSISSSVSTALAVATGSNTRSTTSSPAFLITFVRVNDPYLGSLKQAQVITLVIMIVGVPLLVYLIWNREKYKAYE